MADAVIEAARVEGRSALTEPEGKAVLEAAGLAVPDHRVVETVDAAVDAAESLGYPVVVKVVASDVQHKSEWGQGAGVAVGLQEATAVRDAAGRIVAALDEAGSDGQLLVEAAADVDAGTELLLGGTRHPSFGPTVTLGLGGIYAEVFNDVAHRLAPIEPAEAHEMLEEFAGGALLAGVRGRPAADIDAVVDAVVSVGDLLVEEPAIAEVDVNPLLATAGGAVALDALVVLEDGD